jgi:hypothetical protein
MHKRADGKTGRKIPLRKPKCRQKAILKYIK